MKRIDQIKLHFTRNWKWPGKERLSRSLKPSKILNAGIKNGIVWLTDENVAVYITGESFIEWMILSTGDYENEINKLIRISLKPGNNALDIGGNIGLQSIRMSQSVGEMGTIIAFEPLAYLQEKFLNNITLNGCSNVKLLPYALSDEEANGEYNIDRNLWNQGAFSLSNKGGGPESQKIVIKIADDVPEIQNLSSINMIKIDVEGYENQVLRGLKQTLLKHKPRIIFEYDSNYWNKTGQKIDECYSFLQSLNYTIYQITSIGCELITNVENIITGELFCISA